VHSANENAAFVTRKTLSQWKQFN